jgi:hypothetical protein
MSLDAHFIATKMLSATESVVEKNWATTRKYFEFEIEIFAEGLIGIVKQRAAGTLCEDGARKYIEGQKRAWKTVLISVACLSRPIIEQALDAALSAIRWIINPSVGFELL